MTPAWWLWSTTTLILVLVLPVGYGWSYRGWGAPYPRFIQRRRAAAAMPSMPVVNHHAWGGLGDFVWMMLTFLLFWAFLAAWLR